ncbi:MAG TPA: hypothetical protein DEV93_04455 [Chloroflexi bacterium]|jgi:hypothetical protein|nr:hypothetical protein [Chloroflexota bacterium]
MFCGRSRCAAFIGANSWTVNSLNETNLKSVNQLLRRAAGESVGARLIRALLVLAVVGFSVLAVKSIMIGDDAPTKEATERAAIALSGTSVVTLDSIERTRAGIEIVAIGRNAAATLRDGIISVPQSAIRRVDGNSIVFVEDTLPNRFLPRFVHVGSVTGNGMVEIAGGLLPGDEVVIRGGRLLEAKLERGHFGPFHTSK